MTSVCGVNLYPDVSDTVGPEQDSGSGSEMVQRKEIWYLYLQDGTVCYRYICFEELNIFLVGRKLLLDLGKLSRSLKRNILDEENLFVWFICKS